MQAELTISEGYGDNPTVSLIRTLNTGWPHGAARWICCIILTLVVPCLVSSFFRFLILVLDRCAVSSIELRIIGAFSYFGQLEQLKKIPIGATVCVAVPATVSVTTSTIETD